MKFKTLFFTLLLISNAGFILGQTPATESGNNPADQTEPAEPQAQPNKDPHPVLSIRPTFTYGFGFWDHRVRYNLPISGDGLDSQVGLSLGLSVHLAGPVGLYTRPGLHRVSYGTLIVADYDLSVVKMKIPAGVEFGRWFIVQLGFVYATEEAVTLRPENVVTGKRTVSISEKEWISRPFGGEINFLWRLEGAPVILGAQLLYERDIYSYHFLGAGFLASFAFDIG